MYPRIQIPFISPNNYITVYLKDGIELLWIVMNFASRIYIVLHAIILELFRLVEQWPVCGAFDKACSTKVDCRLVLPGSGSTCYLVNSRCFSKKEEDREAWIHKFMLFPCIKLKHLQLNQGTTITPGSLGHCRVRLHATTFLKIEVKFEVHFILGRLTDLTTLDAFESENWILAKKKFTSSLSQILDCFLRKETSTSTHIYQ